MKYQLLLITILLFFNLSFSYAQENEIWTSFQDEKTELIGYKDSNQNIKIKPKFIFTIANQFKNIIAVMEQIDDKTHESYYLLKNGKKVGIDNIYIWDNDPDCETEEKIRFRDKTTDKVGFFDKNGKIIIPALYSDALPFRNNMAVALKNAKRVCWDKTEYSDKNKCEHWSWKGGQTCLINTSNEILIEDIDSKKKLDWFSLKITETRDKDLIRDSFKGLNGKYYSFINFKKEFKNWFKSVFLKSSSFSSLKKNSFQEITFWSETKSDWIKINTDTFLVKNKKALTRQINSFQQGTINYSILQHPIDPFILGGDQYTEYYNLCGKFEHWKNPVFDVVVSNKNKEGETQLDFKTYFNFLRTENGYKLISLGFKDKEFAF